MNNSGNKIIFVCAGHDTGKFVITNSLKNNPNIYCCDYIGMLFKKYQNKPNKILKATQEDRDCKDLISFINFDILKEKHILLLTWHYITDVIKYIEVFPIFLFRDIRIGWLVTEHKKHGYPQFYNMSIDQYIEKQLSIFEDFRRLSSERHVSYYRFEDFLIDKKLSYSNVCFSLDVSCQYSEIISEFKEKNHYISMFDIEKIVKFRGYVTDDQLEYISSKTKDFNKFMNYPISLTKEQILEG